MPWLLIAGILIGIANDNLFSVLGSCFGFVPAWFIYISLMKHHAWYQMKVTAFGAMENRGWSRTKATTIAWLGEIYTVLSTTIPVALLTFLIKYLIS